MTTLYFYVFIMKNGAEYMAVAAFLVFASAFAASVAVFWLTLAPAMPRIVALLRDGVDPATRQMSFSFSFHAPRARLQPRAVPVVARPKLRAAA